MRYELHGIISRPEVLDPIVEACRHARPVLLDGAELAMVPLCDEVYRTINLPGFQVDPENGFDRLSSGVAALITAASRRGAIAYLEADYDGGASRQVAAVWLDCQIVYGPNMLVPGEGIPTDGTSPFCEALRYLGVQAVGRVDEVVVLGLGRYNRTEAWCAAGTRA
ncbi:hypothetical protein [Actinomycetospora flava]|uniref:Uncharacterized protein n=1 Tax=Actinomycetospora flava TaxID=3129232 RepID=A0ABU8MAH0_9PSEU